MADALEAQISKTVRSGIAALAKLQTKNGSFFSLSAPTATFSHSTSLTSVFSSALILECLANVPAQTVAGSIKKSLVTFLLSQKSPMWSFNYWDRQSAAYQELRYPDDWDDTACALAALQHYDPQLISPSVLAKIIPVLAASEVALGGPYHTWVVSSEAEAVWKDVDLVVNSNLAYFLSGHHVALPNLIAFLDQKIITGQLSSPYYPNRHALMYFLCRGYQGQYREKLQTLIWQKQKTKGSWSNPLDTALCLTSLLRLGADPETLLPSVQFLLNSFPKWPVETFYTGVNPHHRQKYVAGSLALSLAFGIEALQLFSQLTARNKNTAAINTAEKLDSYHQHIIALIQKDLPNGEIKPIFTTILQQMVADDTHHLITLTPVLFAEALDPNLPPVPADFLPKLSLANLYGWIAYTIYDDFLDEEGQLPQLSVANFCLRRLTVIFTQLLPPESGFMSLFQKIMDELDSANTWEVQNCRITITNGEISIPAQLPNFKNLDLLAAKSMGHALGPLAILIAKNFSVTDPQIKYVKKFFKHYLLIRQLHDDLHDWQNDFKRGQLNPISAHLLQKYRNQTLKSLESINRELLRDFWQTEITTFTKLILKQAALAKKALRQLTIVKQPQVFEKMLARYEQAAQEAINDRQQTIAFMAALDLS